MMYNSKKNTRSRIQLKGVSKMQRQFANIITGNKT